MRPVIGIPCQADFRAGSKRPVYGNNRTYVHAVESAGGLPILIPMLNDLSELQELLPRLDGVLFSGGIDMQPSLYGAQPHPAEDEPDPRLDEFELTIASWVLEEDLPVLGVCRGMQLLNVLQGGTLYQDIASQCSGALNHCRRDRPRTELTHAVTVAEGSRMERVLGKRQVSVNSLHHQAIKDPGRGIRISGWAEDGIAELMEMPEKRFVLGIQGHPEELYGDVSVFARFFKAFVRACANLSSDDERPTTPLAAIR